MASNFAIQHYGFLSMSLVNIWIGSQTRDYSLGKFKGKKIIIKIITIGVYYINRVKALLNDEIEISERRKVKLRVYSVASNRKFPDGIKVSFLLLDVVKGKPYLLVDNQEPFGFHAHMDLPLNKDSRQMLSINTYEKALDEFCKIVWEILANEKN